MEKEYIEREAVLNDIGELFTLCYETLPNDCGHHFIVENELKAHLDFVKSIPTASVREVVLCKDCKYWKDRHIRQKDGIERKYRDDEPEYVDLTVGVNVGAMCCYEDGRGWGGMDKRVYRNQDDFCSRGERRPVKYEKWWGIVDGKYPT